MIFRPQRTILVVEDNSDSREMLCLALHHQGYNVIEAEDGKQAMLAASRNRPDLILMDLAMPEMGGLDAARRILQVPKLAHTPIFVVTAFATSDVKADVISAGCTELLEKPVDLDILIEKIKNTLSAKPLPLKQQRAVERVVVSIPVNWGLTRHCLNSGTITSLSVNGCLIESDSVETLSGKTIFLSLQLPNGRSMLLQGRALYYLKTVVFGMEFVELSEEDKNAITTFVEHSRKDHG